MSRAVCMFKACRTPSFCQLGAVGDQWIQTMRTCPRGFIPDFLVSCGSTGDLGFVSGSVVETDRHLATDHAASVSQRLSAV